MGLLTPKGKKGDKKNGANNTKANGAAPSASKFMNNKGIKASGGFVKKGTTGGSQRGS